MFWYIFIFAGIAVMIFAYRTKKSLGRLGRKEVSTFRRFLGTDCGVNICASAVLAGIVFFILNADPGPKKLKELQLRQELEAQQIMAEKLARHLAAKAKRGSKALVIIRDMGPSGRPYREALLKGLRQGFDGKVRVARTESVKVADPNSVEDPGGVVLERLYLQNDQLDDIIKRHRDCQVVVSFIGVANNYQESNLPKKVSDGKTLFGLYTNNVYLLGPAIARAEITVCVVPHPLFRWEDLEPKSDADTIFTKRYLVVTQQNVRQLAGKHRKLFFLTVRPY